MHTCARQIPTNYPSPAQCHYMMCQAICSALRSAQEASAHAQFLGTASEFLLCISLNWVCCQRVCCRQSANGCGTVTQAVHCYVAVYWSVSFNAHTLVSLEKIQRFMCVMESFAVTNYLCTVGVHRTYDYWGDWVQLCMCVYSNACDYSKQDMVYVNDVSGHG